MDVKRACFEIVFHDIPINKIIDYIENRSKNLFDFQDFYNVSLDKMNRYSKDEVENIYDFLCESINLSNCATLFFELGKCCNEYLIYDEYEPKVKYEKLMRWNMLSHVLGQDLPITAFLAFRDYIHEDHTIFFAYRSVISTNNHRLQNILSEGMAENHFHLKGSTKVFEINWLSLMNHPFFRDKEFESFKYKLIREKLYEDYNTHSLYTLVKFAACIRMYLFLFINKRDFGDNYLQYEDELLNLLKANEDEVNSFMNIIQNVKNLVQFNNETDLDYALKAGISNSNCNGNYILTGERRLLYECIYQMILGNMEETQTSFLYLYILIKNKLRSEMIQVNNRNGFENFSSYEKRKETFIEGYKKYKNELIRLAVINTCLDQNVKSLEARITPKAGALRNIKQVQELDAILNVEDQYINVNGYKTEFFYVYHFIKKKDDIDDFNELKIRNHKVRKEVEKQAKAIALAIEQSQNFRKRVKGIDACNNENFCRPEVFAQAFRFLHGLNFSSDINELREQVPVSLNMTYHAGEDFFDIVDGLRAIDEAVLFCNLDNQSRIGHAIALGIDTRRYYENKSRLVLTNLNFLDNIAWLFSKCIEYDIDLDTSYLNKIKSEFNFIFHKVYKDCRSITIDEYYDAWKLRGDNPDLYEKGYYQKKTVFEKYDQFKENRSIKSSIRKNVRLSQLYYAYHYDQKVREIGSEKYIFEVDHRYIELIEKVQIKMQFDLSKRGIMIECNPTSNFFIAQLLKYEHHPMIKFYNYDLSKKWDPDCAQLCVSINTDDQGVFDTSLENEYALMAFALEHCKDENGNYIYTPTEVYKWIDSVRKMGLQQKFR